MRAAPSLRGVTLVALALATLSVCAAAQDPVYVTIGSGFQSQAVLKWDGFNTTVPFATAGSSATIGGIAVDEMGKLWVAASDFMSCSLYGFPPSLPGVPLECSQPNMLVYAMAADYPNVYFGGNEYPLGNVIRRWDGMSNTIHFILPGNGNLVALADDGHGDLWVLLQTYNGFDTVQELHKLPATSWTPEFSMSMGQGYIRSIEPAGTKGMYLLVDSPLGGSDVYFWDEGPLLPVFHLDAMEGKLVDFGFSYYYGDLRLLIQHDYSDLQICVNSASNPVWTLTGAQSTAMAMMRPVWMWSNLCNGVPGGSVEPRLLGFGQLSPGVCCSTLNLTDAPASKLGWLVAGPTILAAPFGGGVMVPQPSIAIPIGTTAEGSWNADVKVPFSVPAGSVFYLQAWFIDPTATAGFTASNAIRAEIE
jgi:hypothetical protein